MLGRGNNALIAETMVLIDGVEFILVLIVNGLYSHVGFAVN